MMTSVFIPEVPLGSVVAMASDTVEVLNANRICFFFKMRIFSQENEYWNSCHLATTLNRGRQLSLPGVFPSSRWGRTTFI